MTQPRLSVCEERQVFMHSFCRLQKRSWFWPNFIIMKFLWDRVFIIFQKCSFDCLELGLCEFVKLILNFPNLACLQSSYGFIRNLKMIKRNRRLNLKQIRANHLLIIHIIFDIMDTHRIFMSCLSNMAEIFFIVVKKLICTIEKLR